MRPAPQLYRAARALAGLLALAVSAACAPAAPPAKPAGAALGARAPGDAVDPAIAPLLTSACAPCHSAERRDPWYAKIAPSSWSTTGARRVLDLSTWSAHDPETRAGEIQMIADAVRRGTMPPADYTFFNHGARLSAEQRRTIAEWAATQAAR